MLQWLSVCCSNNTLPLIIRPGPNFIIKDLPSVLILMIADQILNDSLCWSNKYN